MGDRHVEVSSQGWLSRLGDSIKGVLVGLLMFVAAFPLLWWNEGRAVQTARSLEEGAGAVVEGSADKVDPALEGKLVHVTGTVTVQADARDDAFGVTAPGALRIERHVEMYQWKEHVKERTEKKVGGSTETIKEYTYEKEWASSPISSSSFKQPGHTNPGSFPVSAQESHAGGVKLGAHALPDRISARLGDESDLPVTDAMLAALPSGWAGRVRLDGGAFYIGASAASPQVGDVRIRFRVARPGPASVVSVQRGDSFEPYKARAGDNIELVRDGTHAAAAMFQGAQDANVTMTWILRFLGWFLMALGIYLVFKPLAVVADVVPLFGSMLAFGAGLFAVLLSGVFSSVTIAFAWVFYRPLVAVLVFLIGVVAAACLAGMSHRRKVLAQVRGSAQLGA